MYYVVGGGPYCPATIMSDSDIALTAANQFVQASNGVPTPTGGSASPARACPRWCCCSTSAAIWMAGIRCCLAPSRPAAEVIPVDNAGVGLSSGTVRRTITEMARDYIAFTDALGLTRIDLLGFSIGGMIAQELTYSAPSSSAG